MASMVNKTQDRLLVEKLEVAKSFRRRAIGLIGTKNLESNHGVWFPKSNWIHTFFMSIPIDVIYLDKAMKVQKLQTHLKPWRFPAPVLKANSVLEVQAGFIQKNNVVIGDILHVGD